MSLRTLCSISLTTAFILTACNKVNDSPKISTPSLNERVTEICNAAAKDKFTPGGEIMLEDWKIEKKQTILVASSVAKGMNYSGVLFDSPIKCIVSLSLDGNVELKDVDLIEGGVFDFDKVKDPPKEVEFQREIPGN